MLLNFSLDLMLCLLVLLWGQTPALAAEEAPLVAVYAVRGQTARLPCNLTTAPEDPVIVVLWYKNGTKIPVFSVDFRSRGLQEAGSGSTRPSDAFGGRATFQEQQGGWSWVLVVREVEFTDQGEFRCRLDFQSSPTHNGRVLLRVVDLPRQLRIYSPGGALVEGVASVQEDQPLTLSLQSYRRGIFLEGKSMDFLSDSVPLVKPLPNVTWWSGPTLLDSEAEEWQEGGVLTGHAHCHAHRISYVTNTLHVAALTRAHLAHNLTCTAANTPALPPLSASVFLRETVVSLRRLNYAKKLLASSTQPGADGSGISCLKRLDPLHQNIRQWGGFRPELYIGIQ
ncbi:uncharacterized protein [Procambarus clarkii]|uniref:uncharacterized protein n=1 Tax=Procambarus clarkii TaxID=6728 RepID=UPI003744431B